MPKPVFSIVIPAHNEEARIADLLNQLRAISSGPVFVVCNGCVDATVDVCRTILPEHHVLQLPVANKAAAINAGLAVAPPGPLFIIDADVRIDAASLLACAAALAVPGIAAVSPVPTFALRGVSPWVAAYYRSLSSSRFLSTGVGGAGVYGLSEHGRALVSPLPDVLADDEYVRRTVPPCAQLRMVLTKDGAQVRSLVRPPRTLAALLRTEARWRRGDRLLSLRGLRRIPYDRFIPEEGSSNLTGHAHPGDLPRYVLVKLLGRLLRDWQLLLGRETFWYRDASSRLAGAPDSDGQE